MKRVMVMVVMLAIITIMANRIMYLENQRYALVVGMCEEHRSDPIAFMACLETTNTRTSNWWHLYYGLTNRGSLPD